MAPAIQENQSSRLSGPESGAGSRMINFGGVHRAARLDDPAQLGKDARARRVEVENAIHQHQVNTMVGQGQRFGGSVVQAHIRQASFGSRLPRPRQQGGAKVKAQHPTRGANAPGGDQRVGSRATAQVEHRRAAGNVREDADVRYAAKGLYAHRGQPVQKLRGIAQTRGKLPAHSKRMLARRVCTHGRVSLLDSFPQFFRGVQWVSAPHRGSRPNSGTSYSG